MYHPDNGQRSYKPETKHAESLVVHKNTREHTVEYAGAEKQTDEKVRFRHLLLSHTKLLTSIAYKLKHVLSYFTHRTISLLS